MLFTKAFPFPFLSICLLTITSLSSASMPNSFNSASCSSLTANTPCAKRYSSPSLTISALAFSPIKRFIPLKIIDFPAPVSPVKTINPFLNSKSTFSIIAKFSIFNSFNIDYLPTLTYLSKSHSNLYFLAK